jgi:hypothetical protein
LQGRIPFGDGGFQAQLFPENVGEGHQHPNNQHYYKFPLIGAHRSLNDPFRSENDKTVKGYGDRDSQYHNGKCVKQRVMGENNLHNERLGYCGSEDASVAHFIFVNQQGKEQGEADVKYQQSGHIF